MKNTFGNNVTLTLFGESHGQEIGVVIDGLAPGISVNEEFIASQLTLRRPAGAISTARSESDRFRIVSGVYNGYTTGTPICIIIPNEDKKSGDYKELQDLARPGHADYTSGCKYHGFQDHRGGGHFSGRLTAAIVAVGAIAIDALAHKGVKIATHIKKLHSVSDRDFDIKNIDNDMDKLNRSEFAVLDEAAAEAMKNEILAAKKDGDSVGGVLETIVTGLDAGLGEPWFDTVEGLIAHGMFSVPGIKGVEFGEGFGMAEMYGSEANDSFRMENGKVVTETNHNGGINGGITNGMPILFRCAVKPTPSIFKEQATVNMSTGENSTLSLSGRHDPAIIHRARVVVDSMTALILCDVLSGRYGTDYLGGTK